MAQTDWQELELKREEKLARLISTRYNLTPPIDVFNLAREFADIEEAEIDPGVSCDAISIRHPTGKHRPRIILNRRLYKGVARERFTLSHEIGHLLLPWHCGTVACPVNEDVVFRLG